MELISSLVVVGIFTALYFLGRKLTDYPLELLGALGFIIMGVVSFGTGVQDFSLQVANTTATVTGNVTVVAYQYSMVGKEIPTANVMGMFFILIGIALSLVTYIESLKEKRREAE